MSAVVKLVKKVWNAVVDVVEDVLDAIGDVLESLWKDVLLPIVEFVVGLFGIEDETIISTEVMTQRVIKDDIDEGLMTKIALEHQKDESVGIIDRLMAYSEVVRKKYTKYFTYGRDTFYDGLPDTNLQALVVDNVSISDSIRTELGTTSPVTVVTSRLGVPTKEEFVGYELQRDYGYTPYNNELPYLGDIYKITNIDYNFGTDVYDVYVTSYEDVVTKVITTVTVTVTPIDTTTDNKNTLVEERTSITGTKSGVISDTTTVLSNVDEVVAVGTATGSAESTTATTTAVGEVYATAHLTKPAYKPVQYYVVKYYLGSPSEWYYWVYAAGVGTYPNLDASNSYLDQLEMLPVVTLRNSTVNINVDKNGDRYKHSRDMLSFLGIDVDQMVDGINDNPSIANIEDAFVHFGLLPNDSDPIVSEALFRTFDYMFSDPALQQGSGTKAFVGTIREGPFNSAMSWESQSRQVFPGSIGSRGTYKHRVVGKNLVMEWQAVENRYVRISINNLAAITFIDRQGIVGTVVKDVDQAGFFVPLSIYFVKQLSPIEQYEVFNKTLLLSIYSAEVTYLKWYETEAFGDFLGIVGIVITIVTFGYGATVGGLITALTNVAIMVGAGLFLQMVMEATDNEFIQVLAVIAYAYFAGNMTLDSLSASASTLTQNVTLFATTVTSVATGIGMYVNKEMGILQNEYNAWFTKVSDVQEKLDDVQDGLQDYLSTGYISNLSSYEPISAVLRGPDAQMYKAIEGQYAFDLLYDYNRQVEDFYEDKLRLGII